MHRISSCLISGRTYYNRLSQTFSQSSSAPSRPHSITSSASAPVLTTSSRLISGSGMKLSEPMQLQQASFPHYNDHYMCCCNSVHVKQGTQMIGIVCAVLSAFGIFSTLFAKETPLITALELLFLCVEILSIVLLFMALYNEKKQLLVPFMLWQLISLIICVILFVCCLYAIWDPDSLFGRFIQNYVIGQTVEVYPTGNDAQNLQIEDSVDMNLLVRMGAGLTCIAFVFSFLVSCWFLSVIYRTYRYFSDVSRHREPYADRPVLYSVQYSNSAY